MSHRFDIARTVFFESPPEGVFEAFTDARMLEKWWPVKATIDPRNGGRFSFGFKGGFVLNGRLMRFKRNKLVSYSWVENTIPTFEVTRKGTGTLLRLRHVGFVNPEDLAMTASGWGCYLTNLKSVLDHGIGLRSKKDGF